MKDIDTKSMNLNRSILFVLKKIKMYSLNVINEYADIKYESVEHPVFEDEEIGYSDEIEVIDLLLRLGVIEKSQPDRSRITSEENPYLQQSIHYFRIDKPKFHKLYKRYKQIASKKDAPKIDVSMSCNGLKLNLTKATLQYKDNRPKEIAPQNKEIKLLKLMFQNKLKVPVKSKWGSKFFNYKGIFKCASCKSTVIGEERYRKRLDKPPRKHIYYHCSRQKNYDCTERYITQEKLEKQMLRFINFMYIAHINKFNLSEKIKEGMENYKKMRDGVLLHQNIDPTSKPWDIRDYAKHIFCNGISGQKRELFKLFDYQLYIKNRMITTLQAH